MNNTPRDHPYQDRPHRIYVALTNHCNRSCPWCSMYSSPKGSTYISRQQLLSVLPEDKTFELQLEGGEPTTHKYFWDFVSLALENQNCSRLIVCTNGTRLPRVRDKLSAWLSRLGQSFTIKVSINHHLYQRDRRIFELASLLAELLPLSDSSKNLVLNVRLREGSLYDESVIRWQIKDLGLEPWANIFYLQKYGLASNQSDWKEPFVVGENFSLYNPDGRNFGVDLVSRSEAMKELE